MPSFCVVANCKHKYAHSENISFHKFPLNSKKEILEEWIRFADRGDNWKPSRWSSICSRHFLPSDYRDLLSRRCLKNDAIPSISISKEKNSTVTTSMDDFDDSSLEVEVQISNKTLIVDDFDHRTEEQEADCSLCGELFDKNKDANTCNTKDILKMISNCMPTVIIQEDDCRKICWNCRKSVTLFSSFLDKVMSFQKKLQQKLTKKYIMMSKIQEYDRKSICEVHKTIKIKQEPCIVKEEVTESYREINENNILSLDSEFNHPMDDTMDYGELNQLKNFITVAGEPFTDDYFLDNNMTQMKQPIDYSNFDDQSSLDTTGMNQNNEIMEITTFDKILIDIAETSDNDEPAMIYQNNSLVKNRIEIISSIPLKTELLPDEESKVKDNMEYFSSDHNYSKSIFDFIDLYKTEKIESNTPIYVNENKFNNDGNNVFPIETNSLINLPGKPLEHGQAYSPKPMSIMQIPRIKIIANSLIPQKCDICNNHFENSTSLKKHKVVMHSLQNRVCSICSTDFKSVYNYLVHRTKVHGTFRRERILKRKILIIKCSDCGQTFQNKLALNNHKRFMCSAKKGLTFTCKYCGLAFKKSLLLRSHCKEIHIIPRKVIKLSPLKLGTQKFHTSTLEKAETRVNVDETNLNISSITKSRKSQKYGKLENGRYPCEHCGRTYGRSSNLRRHLAVHRPREQWNHKCGDCGIFFDKVLDLRRHLKTNNCNRIDNTPNASKLFFICSICGRKLSSYNSLKMHETMHLGIKPCICETCGKSFRCPPNLWQHKLTHLDVRKYKCNQCTKVFKRSSGLSHHIKAYHLNLRPHSCPVCKRAFALKADMKRCKHSSLKS